MQLWVMMALLLLLPLLASLAWAMLAQLPLLLLLVETHVKLPKVMQLLLLLLWVIQEGALQALATRVALLLLMLVQVCPMQA